MLRVRRGDNLHCILEAQNDLLLEIHELFSFASKGYQYSPQYKAGLWDGRIKLFDLRTRRFPVGLLPLLIKHLEKDGLTDIQIDRNAIHDNHEIDQEALQTALEACCYTPREYQYGSIEAALKWRKSLLLAPTGSGKSLIIYALVRYLLEMQEKDILITVPTVSLVNQLKSDFMEYTVDDWSVEDEVHLLFSGQEKTTSKRVIIATCATAAKFKSSWSARFGALIVDEAHRATNKTISDIIRRCANVDWMTGLTATLDGTKIHELQLRAHFGSFYETVSTADLMDEGTLARLHIEALVLEYPKSVRDTMKPPGPKEYDLKKKQYQKEINFLIECEERNRLIVKLARSQSKNTLILVNKLSHIDALQQILEKKGDRKLFVISGEVAAEARETMRKQIEAEDRAIVLATYGVFSTGINIKNLHCLIFAHPYKTPILIRQSIGRIIRAMSSKEFVTLIDIADDFRYTTRTGKLKTSYVYEHFFQRLAIYGDQKFPTKVIRIPIMEGK